MSDQSAPSTKHAGESNPYTGQNIAWGAVSIFVLLAPVAVITALIAYLTFSVGRVHPKVIGGAVGLYALGLTVTGQLVKVFEMYAWSFLNALDSISQGDVAAILLSMFTQQAPASVLVGGILGWATAGIRYRRRPVWQETKFRKTPVQIIRKRRNISDIKNDRGTPTEGRTLGINEDGDRIVQTESESAAHTLIFGGSGTGKSTTMMTGARDIIKRGEGLIIVDMKGTPDMAREAAELAQRYNRPFYHWSSQNPHRPYTGPSPCGPAYYDAIGRGDSTRRTDIVMAGREWSEDYYRLTVQSYLQKAFEIINGTPNEDAKVDSISEIMALLDPMALKKRSLALVGNPSYDAIIQEINELTDKRIDKDMASSLSSMREQLGILRNSIQGQWLRKDPEGKNDINFFEVAHQGAVVVFSIDSSTYENNAKTLGNLIIQDLKTVAGELREDPSRYPLNIFIDEFSAIGSDNIIGLLARCRDAGMPVTLSGQSLGDLRTVSSSFMGQLIGIVSSLIIHRANSLEDAEVYAGFSGHKTTFRHSEKVEQRSGLFSGIGVGASTGSGTVEEIKDFRVSTSDIQDLRQGELFFIAKSTGRIERVTVIKEDSLSISEKNDYSTSKEDAHWTPLPEERVSTLSPEEIQKYSIDPTINDGLLDSETTWNSVVKPKAEHKSNPDALARIFAKENLRENTAPVDDNDLVLPLTKAPVTERREPVNSDNAAPKRALPKTPRPALTRPSISPMPQREPAKDTEQRTLPAKTVPAPSPVTSRVNRAAPQLPARPSRPQLPSIPPATKKTDDDTPKMGGFEDWD